MIALDIGIRVRKETNEDSDEQHNFQHTIPRSATHFVYSIADSGLQGIRHFHMNLMGVAGSVMGYFPKWHVVVCLEVLTCLLLRRSFSHPDQKLANTEDNGESGAQQAGCLSCTFRS